MASSFEIRGRDEFLQALRSLPDEMREEGAQMVEARAREANGTITAEYEAARESGNLVNHQKIEIEHTPAGTIARIKNTAKHAHIYENGTQIRKTKAGANRGSMPPAHVFIPNVIRSRRSLTEDLVGLLQRAGFAVRRV